MSFVSSQVFLPSKNISNLVWGTQKANKKTSQLFKDEDKENCHPNQRIFSAKHTQKTFNPYEHYHHMIMDRYCESLSINVFTKDPFEFQLQVTQRMKRILMNWVVTIHRQFKLKQRTLFLLENILVRYLSAFSVSKNTFQLLGLASLWIASKSEDIYAPHVGDLWKVALNKFSTKEIIAAEQEILKSNQFEMIFVSAYDICHSLLHLNGIERADVRALAELILELHLFDANIRVHSPGQLAVFAINVSLKAFNFSQRVSWKAVDISDTAGELLVASTRELLHLLRKDKLSGLREKYGKTCDFLEAQCLY